MWFALQSAPVELRGKVNAALIGDSIFGAPGGMRERAAIWLAHVWFSSCVLASSGFGGGAVTTGQGTAARRKRRRPFP